MADSRCGVDVSRISYGLYRIVNDIVGSDSVVRQRRENFDIWSTFFNCYTPSYETGVISGSRGEGLVFQTSDFDLMFIDKYAVALPEYSIHLRHFFADQSIFVVDFDHVYPGFAFVRCFKCDHNNETLYKSLKRRGRDIYASSKSIRESFVSTKISFVHGPCQSSHVLGKEFDKVYALKCPVWPTQAQPFIQRSLESGWPSRDTLTDIITDGYLLIPINSKHQRCIESADLEWRISFSLAEQKLIFSMNHCQFLCYGLLKLFLNEILKKIPSIDDLLCSYFMKTAIFWEISSNRSEWLTHNFLSKFWNVFRRLMSWVNNGYCPNFFIPENNMFYGKICGEKQNELLKVLSNLYAEGYFCLLNCESLTEKFLMIVNNLDITEALSCNEEQLLEELRLEGVLFFDTVGGVSEIKTIMENIKTASLLNVKTTEMSYALRFRIHYLVQLLAESFFIPHKSLYQAYTRNRIVYQYIKAGQTMLLRTRTFAFMEKFYFAKHMYRSGNYYKRIILLEFIKKQFLNQPYIYIWIAIRGDITPATEQGLQHDALIKSYMIRSPKFELNSEIEELNIELNVSIEFHKLSAMYIPPLVFINFLLFLSFHRLAENKQKLNRLRELHIHQRQRDLASELYALLNHDNGFHILNTQKAISWHILGICQQLLGDNTGAMESYKHALSDENNYFKQATEVRINSLKSNDSDSDSIPTLYYDWN